MDKIKIIDHGVGSAFWLAGWMFTIGYMKLAFWPGALALIIWPYHIGTIVAGLAH